MYLNKAFIIGNLTRDPEVKALPSGMKVCSFSLATNSVYKDKDGNKKEQVEYHNVVVFGRQAETSGQYLKKGQSAYVEGRMQTRSWDGSDGQKKYRTEVVAERVQFGPKGTGQAAGGGSYPSKNEAPGESSGGSSSAKGSAAPMDTIDYPEEQINPDDIPF